MHVLHVVGIFVITPKAILISFKPQKIYTTLITPSSDQFLSESLKWFTL